MEVSAVDCDVACVIFERGKLGPERIERYFGTLPPDCRARNRALFDSWYAATGDDAPRFFWFSVVKLAEGHLTPCGTLQSLLDALQLPQTFRAYYDDAEWPGRKLYVAPITLQPSTRALIGGAFKKLAEASHGA